jgi:hypothetical protein
VTRADAAKLFDLLADEFRDFEITVRKEANAAADDAYAVGVRLDPSLELSKLERLVSLVHHPGDLIPGRVEHEGHLRAQREVDDAALWIVVTTKNGEDATGVSAE